MRLEMGQMLADGSIVVCRNMAFLFPNPINIYPGMATRLAFDLALHLDMSAHVSSGVITGADADLRRTVFWAAYTVDQLVSHIHISSANAFYSDGASI
jgi:hypothetical protein